MLLIFKHGNNLICFCFLAIVYKFFFSPWPKVVVVVTRNKSIYRYVKVAFIFYNNFIHFHFFLYGSLLSILPNKVFHHPLISSSL